MGRANVELAHQLAGNDGSAPGFQGILAGAQGAPCPGQVSQLDSGSLYKSPVGSQFLSTEQTGMPPLPEGTG